MKKAIVALFVLMCAFVCFANISEWEKDYFVDEFGDKTSNAFLDSESVLIKYGSYTWETQYCRILIDKKYVSFFLGRVYYDDWIVKTKIPDGSVHTYYCKLDSCGRVYMYTYNSYHSKSVDVEGFLRDLLKGARVIIQPENIYADEKYDFGTVSITLEKLRQVRPNFTE